METILSLSASKALKYFMTSEVYCSIELPPYFDFQQILDFVKDKIENTDLSQCTVSSKTRISDYNQINYKLLANKNGSYSFRTLQITNPFLYYFFIREITRTNNWKMIIQRFKFFEDKHIEVSSIPVINKPGENLKETAIKNWITNLEQRSIELSLKYKYLFKTDITNCYPSIYTHSIEWAMDGKEVAKATIVQKKKSTTFGALIDTYIQSLQSGQTNGIPQGSGLYDFIAEIVLGYSDRLLADKLQAENINDYKILRYRDDYRIFSNSKDELIKISIILQKTLADLNFQMNPDKTVLSEDIINDAIKKDKMYCISNLPIYKNGNSIFNTFEKELLYILQIAYKFPNSGSVCRLMNQFTTRLFSTNKINENITALIAILTQITLKSPKSYKETIAGISHLLQFIPKENEKKMLLNDILEKFKQLPNTGDIEIWLQRISYLFDSPKKPCKYKEALCQIVHGKDIALWNFSWLKPELFKDFPIKSICNKKILKGMTPYIQIKEYSIFYKKYEQ